MVLQNARAPHVYRMAPPAICILHFAFIVVRAHPANELWPGPGAEDNRLSNPFCFNADGNRYTLEVHPDERAADIEPRVRTHFLHRHGMIKCGICRRRKGTACLRLRAVSRLEFVPILLPQTSLDEQPTTKSCPLSSFAASNTCVTASFACFVISSSMIHQTSSQFSIFNHFKRLLPPEALKGIQDSFRRLLKRILSNASAMSTNSTALPAAWIVLAGMPAAGTIQLPVMIASAI